MGIFRTVLYGLATGARLVGGLSGAWRSSVQLGEKQAFREIYALALAKILANPLVFASPCWGRWRSTSGLFLANLFDSQRRWCCWRIASLGLLVCIAHRRNRVNQLILVLAIGEFLAAPLIVDSGGQRVFAATAATRALLVGIGLQSLFTFAVKAIGFTFADARTARVERPVPRLAVASAAALVVLLVLPVTPISAPLRLSPLRELGCPEGETEFVVELERGALGLQIVPTPSLARPSLWVISKDALIAGFIGLWYDQSFMQLPSPTLLVHGTQRLANGFGQPRDFVWFGEVNDKLRRGGISFCLDSHQSVRVAESSYSIAASARPLP